MTNRHDWVPKRETDYFEVCVKWKNFASDKANQDAYGLPPEACVKLVADVDAYFKSRQTYVDDPTPANHHQKNDDKSTSRKSMRSFARSYVRNNPKIPHNVLIQLNLEAPDMDKEKAVEIQTVGPNSRVIVDNRAPGFVRVRYEGARPYGSIGCEIMWQISVDPPADTDSFVKAKSEVFTASPWEKTFTGLKPGEKLYYVLRWVYPRNEYSPWSKIQSAVVPY